MFSKHGLQRLSLWIAIALAMSAGFGFFDRASGQGGPPAATPPRTITVVGRGSVSIEPDVAHVTIGVQVSGDNARQASDEAKTIMKAVLKTLEDLGVAGKDVQTTGFGIHVEPQPPVGPGGGRGGEKTVVYRVYNNVGVTIRDLDKVGDILDAAIEAGANNIYGVTFGVDDPKPYMKQAREKAAADARARAEELAALHDVAVGEVISISEVIGGFGATPPAASAAFGGGGGPIPTGELDLTAELQVVYAIAPKATGAAQAGAAAAQATVETPATPTPVPESSGPPPVVVQKQVVVEPSLPPAAGDVVIEGDETLLPEFVKRYLAPRFPGYPGEPPVDKRTLILGEAPDDLPFELPLPKDASVLATLYAAPPAGVQVFVDAGQTPEDALAFYEAALTKAGLQRKERPDYGSVFAPGATNQMQIFCGKDAQSAYAVMLSAFETGDGRADVRLQIMRSDPDRSFYTPCDMPSPPESAMGPQRLLPPLRQPKGARVDHASMGGGMDSAYAAADIITDLTVGELAEFYANQLQEKGWELVGDDRTKAIAWSEWTFEDKKGKTWSASLVVTKRFTRENALFAMIRVE